MDKAQNEEVVLYDSPEAAQFKTVEGWVGRDGSFWGKDEHMARYCGSTHKRCVCGEVHSKSYTMCDDCIEAVRVERYRARPTKDYEDGDVLYSESHDEYFFDLGELFDYIDNADEPVTIAGLDLLICEPNDFHPLEPRDHFSDILGEDGEVPDEVEAAFDALNAVLEKAKPPSWSPGKYAAIGVPERVETEAEGG